MILYDLEYNACVVIDFLWCCFLSFRELVRHVNYEL